MLDQIFVDPRVLVRLRSSPHAQDLEALATDLTDRGYRPTTISLYVRAAEHYHRWRRARRDLRASPEATVEIFLKDHLPRCDCAPPRSRSRPTVRAALKHLQRVVAGDAEVSAAPCWVDDELQRFEGYLEDTCGLAPATRYYRLRYLREFLEQNRRYKAIRSGELRARDLRDYVADRASGCKAGTVNVIACSLRSYLKWLQLCGFSGADLLIHAIPKVPRYRLSHLPRALTERQLKEFLNSFDFTSSSGTRDYAMALCMAQIGLRAAEVAALMLSDIDWRQGILHIRGGKARRDRPLPFLSSPGKAIARYLRRDRVPTDQPYVFVRHRIPVGGGMTAELVRGAMRRAYARAGFPSSWTGTHLLRHTAATRMHQRGISIKEVADVLGHKSIDTTMIYTKVNLPELRTVALPWQEVRS